MFRVCSHQLKISLCSPRIYIAVFAGIVIQIVSLISFLDFSKTIGKPLCVFESITYSNCDLYAPVALFLAVLVLVSDIPFPCHFRSGKRRHKRHVRDLEALRGLHSETLYPNAERRRGQYLLLCGRRNA